MISPFIEKRETNLRKPLLPKERLVIIISIPNGPSVTSKKMEDVQDHHDDIRPDGLSYKRIEADGVIFDYVDLKKLPQFGILSKQVSAIVQSSSWWDVYGVDWGIHILGAVGFVASFKLVASPHPLIFLLGIFTLGCCHSILNLKAAHSAIHDALCSSRAWNKFWGFFVSDFIGSFSTDAGYDIHVKCHHPHTNIIGLGDSSTWKAPFVPSMLYMFVTPNFVPILAPLVSVKELIQNRPFKDLLKYLVIASAGNVIQIYALMQYCGLSFFGALLVIFAVRNVLSVPYIHINIFQHIGLPMYSQKHRPKKIYQMTSGVLNLPRNPILDYCFGHGIVSCHTEHHLFPRLSDNMCLKIKPLVQMFCEENDLPYHEDSYTGRVWHFLENYETLMVKVPPITKFVGLQ